MVALMLLVPCYLFIANRVAVGTVHAPVLLALGVLAVVGLGVVGFWLAYLVSGRA
jgi:hypothetical protein